MPPWLIWLLGIGVVTTESVLLGSLGFAGLCVQSPIGLAALVAMEREFTVGAGIVGALIVPVEWLAGTPRGFYGLGLVAAFFGVQLIQNRLPREWSVMHLLAGILAGVIHPLVVWGAAGLLAPKSGVALGIVTGTLPSLAGLAVFLSVTGPVFLRLDGFFDGSTRGGAFGREDSALDA